MKVTLIAAMSLDGYIAHGPLEQPQFSSPEDKAQLREKTRAAGIVVMGHNTFKTFRNQVNPLPDRLSVVMTRGSSKLTDNEHVIFRSDPPQKVLDELSKQGYKEAIIFGGSKVNAAFLEAGLLDEMWITLTPHLFGGGVPLFASSVEAEVELLSSEPLGPGEVLLHYRVGSPKL